jgi:hypothetical protein
MNSTLGRWLRVMSSGGFTNGLFDMGVAADLHISAFLPRPNGEYFRPSPEFRHPNTHES